MNTNAKDIIDLGWLTIQSEKSVIILPNHVFCNEPLSEPLLRAICEAKALKSHGAVKRQSQLVGKLMRAIDHEALSKAFEAMQAEDRAQTVQFHAAEAWRDKLLQGGAEALTAFVESFKPDNVQILRQLIKKAQASTSSIQQKTAYTALFRYIKQCL